MASNKPRNANGRSSIYEGSDGYWHGRVTVGTRDDGKSDRRHVRSKHKQTVIDKVRELERSREAGTVREPGRTQTVEEWLTHWVENIAPLDARYKTMRGYQTAVYKHLVPGIGAHKLDRIRPEHFEKLYTKLVKSGLKPATAHQVHRTARTALGEALKRGYLWQNPVALAKAPRVEEEEVEPLDTEEVQRVLKAALGRRNGVRFVVALALGIRQGEALGLKWERFDQQQRTLRIRKALQRQNWRHGCSDPHRCGERYHKTQSCPEGCKRHQRACPSPCGSSCTGHARMCPRRRGGGLVEVDVKSKAGRRTIGLPDQIVELLSWHRSKQEVEREHAGTEWHEGGWIFRQPNGKPLDPRRDLYEWKTLLEEAGVREARLHDARHTAATVLLILGVPDRTVMDMMGWSTISMKQRYMHVTDNIRRDVADQLNAHFWEDN